MEKELNDLESGILAVNKFMFYSWNFNSVCVEYDNGWGKHIQRVLPEFIWALREQWPCNFDHIVDKWDGVCKDSDTPYDLLPLFYARMGSESRRIMLTWILQNYNDEQNI